MNALPTQRDEAWRYSDLDAVARLWPLPAAEHVVVPEGGAFARTIVQDSGTIHQLEIAVGKGATATVHILNIGGDYGRVELNVTLHDSAHFELAGAILGSGEQTLEIVTTVTHAEPNATSNQTVRSVLAGRATGSYLGKVAVARDAQKTDASQSVKAMLLDRTATANAKPELEIYADDVKCAHGATVGELDRNALFYLASRGLPPADAKRLMLPLSGADFLRLAREQAGALGLDMDMLKRPVNVGFSGGEKKRNEMVQMGIIDPRVAILDETDSGLDIDALRVVGDGINRIMRKPDKAVLLITHYQRLLDYVKPDYVHVLASGRITRTGGPELAHELEREGYKDLAA